jgi:2-polyprenyl-3-methyl-5-hydroxy-6-metoxy-1,4-benzoquinol methylase
VVLIGKNSIYNLLMTYSLFLQRITADTKYLNDEAIEYIKYHGRRFYYTYLECAKFLKKGDKVLSMGAGVSCIEKILSEDIGVEVTALDFPDSIKMNIAYFDFLGFKTIEADLSEDEVNLPIDTFNMLICSEVVEHINKSIYEQMRIFSSSIKANGYIVITTPNLGSIMQISKLLLLQPILPSADITFAVATKENIWAHRREYLASEIVDAYLKLGYKHTLTKYMHYTYPKTVYMKILTLVGTIIRRFRVGMIVIGQKQ